jgi:hypothetical protein
MAKFTSPLDEVRVAAPCPAAWEKMVGDERVRFCGECQLHVYNLSGMTRREAEALVTNTEGRLCVRFYRRADGSVLTRNCPTGLRAMKERVSRLTRAALSGALGFLAGLGLVSGAGRAPLRQTVGQMVEPTESAEVMPTLAVPTLYEAEPTGQMVGRPAMGTTYEIKGEMALVGYPDYTAPRARVRKQKRRAR